MRILMKFLFLFCAIFLAACAAKPSRDDASYGASVGIVNHTGKFIYSVSVDGGGGGHMEAWGAGAASVCCVMVPRKWIPGMQVLVSWDMPEGSKHIVKEKRVDVERYDEPGSVYIHIFPDDEIRVVVSNYGGWSKQHPIPAPVKPSEKSS
jgi:hypothetical protein